MSNDIQYEYRTGIGTDIHRLVENRNLMLGGVEVPFSRGLLGHSDADVVLHAVMDAILGAAGLGDIGTLFPDTDEKFKGADSKDLTLIVREGLDGKGWQIVNVDLTVHAEEPKLGPYKAQIKRCVASLLAIDFLNVNVKAKTNEGLDAIGQGLAIGCTAITLIRKRVKRTL